MLKKFIERETEKGDLQVASFIDYEDTEEDESHDDIINELIQTGQEQPEIDGNNTHFNEKELDEIKLVMKKYKGTFSNKPGVSNVPKSTFSWWFDAST